MLPEIPNNQDLIEAMHADGELASLRNRILHYMGKYRYPYNFTWYGRPIIQLPEDVMMLQELILSVRPDLVVETGIAHGGSLVFSASMLSLLGPGGRVVGVDVDIRPHNRDAIERHPLANRIQLIQGSSTDPAVVNQVNDAARSASRVLVLLDSNHTHEHVLQELRQYSPLVKAGSYLVVYDTAIEDMPADAYPDRPWGKGNNPKTAVWEFLRSNDRFVIDEQVEQRLMFTVAPDGYLRCVRDS